MSWLDGFRHRIGALLSPRRHAEEVEQEFEFHLDMDASQRESEREARRRFGNRTVHREEVRAVTWIGRLDVLHQDLRHTIRQLGRDPTMAGLIVATLGLGVGVNAATYVVLDRLYLRPPGGVADPGAVHRYWVEHFRTGNGVSFRSEALSYQGYRAIAAMAAEPARVAAYAGDNSLHLGRDLSGPRVRAVYASANYAAVLGATIARGRFFSAAEDRMGQGAPVAVVSHRFWTTRLDARPGAIGETISLGRHQYTVIGVFEPAFTGIELQAGDVWVPLAAMPTTSWIGERWWEGTSFAGLRAVERWTSSSSAALIEARATVGLRRLDVETEGARADTLQRAFTGSVIEARGPGEAGQDLLIATRLGGVAVIVLLIALANVINLLLARSMERRREIAVRLALGISRGRLIRLLVLEVMALAAIAAVAATLLGWAGGTALRALLLPQVEWATSALDWRVTGFTVLAAIGAGLVAGLPVAIQASGAGVSGALRSGLRDVPGPRSRARSGLVALQAALSVILLVGAAMFVRSLRNVQSLDLGFDIDRLLVVSLDFAEDQTPPTPVVTAAIREAVVRLAERPDVDAVGRSNFEPMWGFSSTQFYTDTDSALSFMPKVPFYVAVSPSYFAAVGLRMIRGRPQAGDDADGGPREVVVNEAMAGQVWPGQDPIGRCLRFRVRTAPCYTVVGVAENPRQNVIEAAPLPSYFLPLGNLPAGASDDGWVILVRPRGGAVGALTTDVRRLVQSKLPGSVVNVALMRDRLDDEYRPWRLGATLFSALGLLSLLVAVVGIYSTVSYGVRQRNREFGIRVALGAQPGDVVRHVVGDGVRVVAAGILAGLVLSVAGGRLVAGLIYGVSVTDPAVLAPVALVLVLAAAVASAVPAWHASRTDPVVALRED